MKGLKRLQFKKYLFLLLGIQFVLNGLVFFSALKSFGVLIPGLILVAAAASFLSTTFLLAGLKWYLEQYLRKTRSDHAANFRRDLKARLPVRDLNFVGVWFNLFNQMVEQLEESAYKVKTIEQNKLRWLQNLAHDVRTPLNTMTLSLETVLEEATHLSEREKESF